MPPEVSFIKLKNSSQLTLSTFKRFQLLNHWNPDQIAVKSEYVVSLKLNWYIKKQTNIENKVLQVEIIWKLIFLSNNIKFNLHVIIG